MDSERRAQQEMHVESIDNAAARERLVAIQQRISSLKSACLLGLARPGAAPPGDALGLLLAEALEIVGGENDRIARLIAQRGEFYRVSAQRWKTLEFVHLKDQRGPFVQPHGWGGRASETTALDRGDAQGHTRVLQCHFNSRF